MRVEQKAMRFARRWWRRRGYETENVSRSREHKGCDLLVWRGRRRLKIEVKGCSRKWQVPDFHETEVVGGRLAADVLFVVYLLKRRRAFACVVPRSEIPRGAFNPLGRFRLSSRFKSAEFLGPFLRPSRH